jgi:hypothetical protein
MSVRPGLSILEVMLALLIIGVSVTALLTLQGKLSRGVFFAHALIDRIPFITSFFVAADKDKLYLDKKAHKKVIEDPELSMTYAAATPSDKALVPFKYLILEKIHAQWPTVMGSRSESCAMLRFVPHPEKRP